MTARTTALDVHIRDGKLNHCDVLAGQKIFKGSPVFADESSGLAQTNDGVTITLVTGDVYLGIADATADNSTGSDGDKVVVFQTQGIIEVPCSGSPSQAKMGDPVYVNNTTDNATFTLTAAGDGSDCVVGYFVGCPDATHAFVMIDKAINNKVGYNPDLSTAQAVGQILVGRMTYDFSVDGGAVGTITPATTCVIPSGAIVLQAITNVITAPTTGTTTTVAVQIQAANDLHTAASVAGAPWSTTGLKAATPVHTAATAIIMTADRTAKVVIGSADLLGGKFTTYIFYVLA